MDKIQFCNLLSPDSAFSWNSWDKFPVQRAPFYWQRGTWPQYKVNGRHQEKMRLWFMYPHTKQMLPHSWYSACWRTGSPATSNKDLQVRFLKTKQLQTCSLTAWRTVCSEDLILQCPDCPQLLFMFPCLQRGYQWYDRIWVWLTTNADDTSNGRKSGPF